MAAVVPMLVGGLLLASCTSGSGSGSSETPAQRADAQVAAGLKAESNGQQQAALSDFQAAVASDPTNKYAYYDLGVIYQQQLNDATTAATYYHKALLVDGSYKPALYNLAILYTTSDPAQAISLYNQLLQLNANDPNVLYNLGLILYAQGQVTQGRSDIDKAIAINPSLRNRLPANVTP